MFGFIATAFDKGGHNMFVILAAGIFMFGVIIERTVVLYFKSNPNKEDFIRILTKYLMEGNLRQALSICSSSQFPLARILHAGLKNAKDSDEAVQAAMDESALRELPMIEKRVPLLALIGNVAVLMGLLGTIFGLINAFAAVASEDASEKATALAGGISEAMYNTAFGLAVAIASSLAFAVFQSKAQQLIDDINESTVAVLNLVTSNRDKFGDE